MIIKHWRRASIAAILVALSVPAPAANLCLTLDVGGPFSTCSTPSNSDITTKLLPAYKPLCDSSTGASQKPPVGNYSCSNLEIWNYLSNNIMHGIQSYVEGSLTDAAKGAVAKTSIGGFPP